VIDLGADNYNMPGYFNTGVNGQRWTYYRMRAEGHNTLVLNPGLHADQDPLAFAKIVKFSVKGSTSFAVADITPAYSGDARVVHRGIALVGGQTVIVNDEIKAGKPVQLYWFMHTPAQTKVSANGKLVVLTIDSAQIEAEIISPSRARFTVLPAILCLYLPNLRVIIKMKGSGN